VLFIPVVLVHVVVVESLVSMWYSVVRVAEHTETLFNPHYPCTVSEDAGIEEPRIVATSALAVRRSNP
jgi:hypothetical protein